MSIKLIRQIGVIFFVILFLGNFVLPQIVASNSIVGQFKQDNINNIKYAKKTNSLIQRDLKKFNEFPPGQIISWVIGNVTYYKMLTGDGFAITLNNKGKIVNISLDDNTLLSDEQKPFTIQDITSASVVSLGGDVSQISSTKVLQQSLVNNLDFNCVYEVSNEYISVDVSLISTVALNASLDVQFALPINATGWYWWDDFLAPRTITNATTIYENVLDQINNIDFGHGKINNLPFATISNKKYGLTMAIDFAIPVPFFMGYDLASCSFYTLFSTALSNIAEKIPGQTTMRFIIYRSDPLWGLRSTAERYYSFYPEYFDNSRCLAGGHAFHAENLPSELGISYVQGMYNRFYPTTPYGGIWGYGDWDDGLMDENFKYKSLQYFSGCTQGEFDCTAEQFNQTDKIPEILEYYRTINSTILNDYYLSMVNSLVLTRTGDYYADWRNYTTTQAWIRNNPDPDIADYTMWNWFINYWINPAFLDNQLIGVSIDGLMADNQGGGIDCIADYNASHFHSVDYPLTYSHWTNKPVVNLVATGVENIQYIRQWLSQTYGDDKIITANMGCAFPQGMFLVPYIDNFLMESEFNWQNDGGWGVINNETKIRWMRMCAYQKTICGLDYNSLNSEVVEQYIQRLLPYGIFPNPGANWTRDIALYQKYIPIFQQLSSAGWEPITKAQAYTLNIPVKDLILERFGSNAESGYYFVLRDVLDDTVVFPTPEVEIHIPIEELGLDENFIIYEMLSNQAIAYTIQNNTVILTISLNDGQTKVLRVFKPDFTTEEVTAYAINPYENTLVEFFAEGRHNLLVEDRSDISATIVTVRFYNDSEYLGESECLLSNSTNWYAKLTFDPGETQQQYLLKAIIDPENEINEIDETNNEQTTAMILPFIWHYKLKVKVSTLAFDRQNTYGRMSIDFQEIFTQLKIEGTLDQNSFRMYSVKLKNDLLCQFVEDYKDGLSNQKEQPSGMVVFPIENENNYTKLTYYLLFDTYENGPKTPVKGLYEFTATERNIIVEESKRYVFSPMTGTIRKIIENLTLGTNGFLIESNVLGEWDALPYLVDEEVTSDDFFWGEILTQGPIVTRILQKHAAQDQYAEYGILMDIYRNGVVDINPYVKYAEECAYDQFKVHSLYWYPDRKQPTRIGYYWNETALNVIFNTTEVDVPKTMLEPWYGQKAARLLTDINWKTLASLFIVHDENFSGGRIATQGDRDWCYFNEKTNLMTGDIATDWVRYYTGQLTLKEITTKGRENAPMRISYELPNETLKTIIISVSAILGAILIGTGTILVIRRRKTLRK